MTVDGVRVLTETVTAEEASILTAWLTLLKADGALQTGRIREAELSTQACTVLEQLRDSLARGGKGVGGPAYAGLRDTLGEISRSRAVSGITAASDPGRHTR